MLSLTLFKSIFDNKTHRKMEFNTLESFEKLLYDLSTQPGYKPKKGERKAGSPLITPSSFEANTTRANRNVVQWNGWAALDVDDYDGLDEGADSVQAKDLTNSSGEVRQGYEGFRVEVTVDQLSGVSGVKRIMIAVTQPNKQVLDFTVYKVNF